MALSVGIRNSIDKTLPLGFCAGNRVFVCDNLSFSADLMVNRKHTVNGGARFREAIALAAGRLEAFQQSEASRVGLMQTLDLDDPTAESLILRAWEAKIISHYQLPAVLKEWREPSHDAFGPRTRWSLFNAFTEILRPFSRSNPQAFAGRTFRLNRLLVPPNEGPAVIDATFQVMDGNCRTRTAAGRLRTRPARTGGPRSSGSRHGCGAGLPAGLGRGG